MNEKLLTPTEVAEYLQVSEPTLADLRYRGRGPVFVKVGRLVRYWASDIEQWIGLTERRTTREGR